MRRIGAAAVLAVCLIAFAGAAAADDPDFSVAAGSGTEGGNVSFTVTFNQAPPVDGWMLNYSVVHGSTSAGDFTTTTGSVFAPGGATSATIDVPTSDDAVFEGNETFTLNVTKDGGASSDDAAGTIADDDTPPTLAISGPASVNEDAGTAMYSVAITGQSANTVSVSYATASGTAASPGDFANTSGSLMWPSGDSAPKPISVPINDDTLNENNESFAVNLSSPSGGATITTGSVSTTIISEDDPPMTGAFANVATTEGQTGTHEVSFTVNLSSASGKQITVNYSTIDGTATSANNDYEPEVNQNLIIPAGSTSGDITITVNGDTVPEPDETFTVNLNSATNATLGDTQAVGTIGNDDSGVTASINDVTLAEGNSGNTNFVFTVSLSAPAPAAGSITWRTADGTANSPGDYTGQGNTTQAIAQNATSFTISIPVVGDNVPESNETFFVDLISSTGPISISADNRGTGTINNDDSGVTASINDVTLAEGNSGNTNFVFTVSLSAPAPAAGSITWRTANGSATSPGDYAGAGNTTQPIAQNATSFQITIPAVGDNVPESNETFFVDLVGSTGPIAIGADSRGTGTINNDDSGVTASINDVTVTEGHTPNTVNANFTVTLSAPAPAPASVTYRTADNSATSPGDYTGVPNTVLSFAQGATTGQITIVVKGDTLPEANETFFVDLVGSSGPVAVGADSRGTGTITDDDSPVTASINDVSVIEGHSGTVNAIFTVTLSGPAQAQVQIRYSTANGSAIQPGDYTAVTNATLTIASGASTGQITIQAKGDTLPEGTSENFFVDLQSVISGPATIGPDSRGTGTITDDDSPVTASINDVTVTEGNGGGVSATFTVTLSGPAQAPVQIQYRTTNGSAVAPGDYAAVASGTVTIGQSQTSAPITITVNGDVLPEGQGEPPSENFFVDLISATGPATISADSRGTCTITDDDSPPIASINDVSVAEGNSGTVNATFTVTLTRQAAAPVQIRYSTVNGSASAPDDYTGVANAILPIAQGQSTGTFSIVVKADEFYEGDENFFVDLISATGPATIGADSRGQGTIVEDDPAPPPPPSGGGGSSSVTLSISDPPAAEGGAANFVVTIPQNTTKTVTVKFETTNGTAVAGSDYVSQSGTLSFAPGEKTKSINVAIINDTTPEGIETFGVNLSEATNAVITKSFGAATIESNDLVAGPIPPTGDPTGPKLPRIEIGPRTLTVNANGVASVRVTCMSNSPIKCTGSVLLETSTVVPKFQLGKKGFTMQKGKKLFLRIKLSERGLKLLLKKGTIRVRVVVFVRNSKNESKRFVPGLLPMTASKALLAKHAPGKTVEKPAAVKPAATTPKPKPKPKPAELPPIEVEIIP